MKLITAAVLAAFAMPVFAQTTSTPRIDQRQQNQQQRIDQGVQSGELNRKEAARLEKGQARIQKMENKAVADGKVTAKERRKIERAQDKQSRKIAREKHDKQHAK
jgi:Tfp pilus assembly protein FimT